MSRQRGDDLSLDAGEGARPGEISLAVLDEDGDELWFNSYDGYTLFPAGVSGAVSGVESPVDANGNIFFEYFVGQTVGVTVLRPVPNGMYDFESLPTDPYRFAGRYGAEVTDRDQDDRYEIVVTTNSCDPSCAQGLPTETTYAWNGSNYQ